jgi:membrane protein YqaA with SNARE-associated domain
LVYTTLFFSALLSATLFPVGSEALFTLYILEDYNPYLLLFFATLGNSLGSLVNYFLGLKGEEFLLNRGYIKEEKTVSAKRYFDKYGSFSLLLSWLPVIGDPITFIAGVMRFNLIKFIVLVILAKFGRYYILMLLIEV